MAVFRLSSCGEWLNSKLMSSLVNELAFPLGDDTDDEDNRIVKILKAWTSTLQPIEDTAQAMILQKNVDDAEGAQLDALGKLVGQDRGGLADVDYRRYIKAKITTNRSDGVTEDLIKITTLIINDPALLLVVQNAGTATVQVFVGGVTVTLTLANILFLFLAKAKSGGVRLEMMFNSSPPADWFYLDDFGGAEMDDSDTFRMFDTLP